VHVTLGVIVGQPRRSRNGAAPIGKNVAVASLPGAGLRGRFWPPDHQNTGFPEASLISDFQVVRIWLVTVSGSGT
jgi:hypothetical protein